MRDEPTGYVDPNLDLAISSVQDLVDINPEEFTHIQVGDYDLYAEKSLNLAAHFEGRRYIGIEHLEPKFPGQPDLKVKRSSIFSIDSPSLWNPVWNLDLTNEEYAVALISATNTLKRDLHKGSKEITTTLPKGEILKISSIPLNLFGQRDTDGRTIREVLEQRHKRE